jgi:hypothetical protein
LWNRRSLFRPEAGLERHREVWDALRQTKKYPGVLRFLIADYFVEDAVATVILNIGLYCSIVLAMPEEQITLFLIISTCTAVLGSVAIGYLAKYWSLRSLLNLIFVGWVVALLVFVITDICRWCAAWLGGRGAVGRALDNHAYLSRRARASRRTGQVLRLVLLVRSGSGSARSPADRDRFLFSVKDLWVSGREWLRLDSAAMVRLPYKMAIAALALMVLVGLAVFRKVPRLQEPHDGS